MFVFSKIDYLIKHKIMNYLIGSKLQKLVKVSLPCGNNTSVLVQRNQNKQPLQYLNYSSQKKDDILPPFASKSRLLPNNIKHNSQQGQGCGLSFFPGNGHWSVFYWPKIYTFQTNLSSSCKSCFLKSIRMLE